MQHKAIPWPAMLEGACNEGSGVWAVSMVKFSMDITGYAHYKCLKYLSLGSPGEHLFGPEWLSVQVPQISSKCI